MEALLKDILMEMREMNCHTKQILEQIEDARAEVLKRNCPEIMKEQLSMLTKMMEGSPLAPVFKAMMSSKMGGV
jgi:hypothetical protein